MDDCSTDKTRDILNNYAEKYDNVKLFSTKNNSGGPSIPRNIGIKKASADYILFLDEDDILLPKTVELLYNQISINDYDFVKINFNIVNNGTIRRNNVGIDEDIIIKPYSNDFQYCSLYIWDGIYKKSFLLDNNIFFENVRCEDYLFMISCICKTKKEVCALNSVEGINYNADNQNSISHNCFNTINLEEHIFSSSKLLDLVECYPFDEYYKKYIASIFKFSGMIYLFYNSTDERKKMYELFYSFLKEYKKYKLIKINEMKYFHYLYWKLVYLLIVYNKKFLLFSFLNLTNKFKRTDRQVL